MVRIVDGKKRLLFNALINSSDSDKDNLKYVDSVGVNHSVPLNQLSRRATEFFKAIVASGDAYPKGLGDKMDTYNRVSKTTFVPKTTSDTKELDRLFKPIEIYAKEAIEISPKSLQYLETPGETLRKEINVATGPNKTEKSDPPQPKELPNPELGRVMGPPSSQEQIDETFEAITETLRPKKKAIEKVEEKVEIKPEKVKEVVEIKPETSPIVVERKKPETVQTYLEKTFQTSKEGATGGFEDLEKELKILDEAYRLQQAKGTVRTVEEILADNKIPPEELMQEISSIDISRVGQNTQLDMARIPLPVQTELLIKEQNLGNLPKKLENQFMDDTGVDKHRVLKDKLNRIFSATKPDSTQKNRDNYKVAVGRIVDKLYDLEPIRNNGMTNQEVFDYVTSHLFNRSYETGPDTDKKMIEARNDFIEELKYYYGEDVYQDVETDMNYFQGAVTLQDLQPIDDIVEGIEVVDSVPQITDSTMVSGGLGAPPIPPEDLGDSIIGTDDMGGNGLPTPDEFEVPLSNKLGNAAVYNKIAIKLVFNSSENPEWDPVLEGNIIESEISNSEAFEIMVPLVEFQGSKIMVNSIKTSMESPNTDVKKELNEVLQLWYSFNRNMSKGPRVPKVGISLGSLMGGCNCVGGVGSGGVSGSGEEVVKKIVDGKVVTEKTVEKVMDGKVIVERSVDGKVVERREKVVAKDKVDGGKVGGGTLPNIDRVEITDEMIAKAWKESHYQYGYGNSGPKDFLPRPRMTDVRQPFKPGTAEVPDRPFARLKFKVDIDKC